MTNKRFHNVFVPAPDIYQAGGSEVFQQFRQDDPEKQDNLLVIPEGYLDSLYRRQGFGIEDSLKEIQQLSEKQKHTEKNTPVSIRPGLEAVILEEVGDDEQAVNKHIQENYFAQEAASQATFITNEARSRIRLNRKKLRTNEASFLLVNEDVVKEGLLEPDNSWEVLESLYSSKNRSIPLEQAVTMLGRESQGLDMNQFVRLRQKDQTLYAKVTGDLVRDSRGVRIREVNNPRLELLPDSAYGKQLRVGKHKMNDVLGISPRDMGQYMALQDGLLNPDVELLFLTGSQGSGKTLLSYVAAADQTLWWDADVRNMRGWKEKGGLYSHTLLLKPTNILGGKDRDVGFLPGDVYQKLKPHLEPYIDSHKESSLNNFSFQEMILNPNYANDFGAKRQEKISIAGGRANLSPKREMVEVVHSGFMRGRSLPNTFMLIDEGQNYTPYEMKTILERAGEGTKVVVMGDPYQQDNPSNTRRSNGLTHAIAQHKNRPYSMIVDLKENYRSQLSEDTREWKAYPS